MTIPTDWDQAENNPLQFGVPYKGIKTINHALITRPVSLVDKDTEVQAYRTDLIQGHNNYNEGGSEP